jgi:SAM-dependent methyltransferase
MLPSTPTHEPTKISAVPHEEAMIAPTPLEFFPRIALDERKILQLGSGRKYCPDAVNVDLGAATAPDLIHDLDQTPWPFPADRFDEVWAYDVLEHLNDVVAAMEEIHRVCRDGAVVRITVPHFSCSNAFTDITHRHYFGRFSFAYFTGENALDFYTGRRFQIRTARIIFYPTLINKVVHRLANRWPAGYERRWAWMFPAWFMSFELIVVKNVSGSRNGL